MISVVLVVVDIGFAGGWDEGAAGVGTTGVAAVTRGVTGGSGLATGWELVGGNGVLRLGGNGRDAG